MRVLLPLLLALALVSTGCVANMADLKGTLDPASVETAASDARDLVASATNKSAPPVARITAFGENNALVYKASFAAEDVASPVFVAEGVEVVLLASDSAAVEPGATLVAFAWKLPGANATATGTRASVTFDAPGVYPVRLNVTDSNGRSDTQTLNLAVAPQPFDVFLNLTTGQLAGVGGQGQPARLAFSLTTEAAGIPATIQNVKVVATPPATCDATLRLLDSEGEPLAEANDADAASGAQTEAIEAGALPEGGYAIEVVPEACIAQDGVDVQVIVTFLALVPGLGEGDEHGGAHGH